jgi:mannose-1-phosphate guanylyltransferase/mannose-1-phosphate guanylyltransferase/mannose-6-phosphate isomerase
MIYNETMFDDCLIMAGGSGTRLWPASSSRLPKQFLPAGESGSFFSMALERAFTITSDNGKVIVITGLAHIPHVIKDAAKLNTALKKRLVVIGEPAAKNTAPAIACAVKYSLFSGINRKMLVLTSDHIIRPLEAFKTDAAFAASSAGEGKFVVFGIPPVRPETGYGYIECSPNERSQSESSQSEHSQNEHSQNKNAKTGVCNVTAFHEKPDIQTAKKYAASKSFFWNSGMFAFSAEFMAHQFRSIASEVYLPFEKLKAPKDDAYTVTKGVRILGSWPGLDNAYNKTKNISFDYAIAEKCPNTVMVRSNFEWIDIGNWEEYVKVCTNDNFQIFNIDAKNCYVDSDIPVALAGVEDLIVVIRAGKKGEPATALITKKGQTQKVRDVVELIKKSGRAELL